MIQELIVHLNGKINIEYSKHTNLWFNGAYFPTRDKIELSSVMARDNHVLVLFHELAHATGHSSRLSRSIVVEMEKGSMSVPYFDQLNEEYIAERVSEKLIEYFNIQLSNRDRSLMSKYLSRNSTGDNLESQIDEAYNFILQNWLAGFNIISIAA